MKMTGTYRLVDYSNFPTQTHYALVCDVFVLVIPTIVVQAINNKLTDQWLHLQVISIVVFSLYFFMVIHELSTFQRKLQSSQNKHQGHPNPTFTQVEWMPIYFNRQNVSNRAAVRALKCLIFIIVLLVCSYIMIPKQECKD